MSKENVEKPLSRQNVEVVQGIYELAAKNGRGNLLAAPHLFDPEVEYVNPEGAVEPGTRRGLEAFREAVEHVGEAWEFWRMEPEKFEAVGNQVVVVARYSAKGRESGAEVRGLESALWTLRNGKVIRYEWFLGPGDAFKAAGLSE
jgi:ketosteroid isomerase-like protein